MVPTKCFYFKTKTIFCLKKVVRKKNRDDIENRATEIASRNGNPTEGSKR